MNRNISIIGDIHKKHGLLYSKIEKNKNKNMIICLGDLDIGMPESPVLKKDLPNNFKFIQGNHDNRYLCMNHPNFLGLYGYLEEYDIFYISGSDSPNKKDLKRWESWWKDEELYEFEFKDVFELYSYYKPEILITHNCGVNILDKIYPNENKKRGSRTQKKISELLEIHKPEYHIFGHHHINFNEKIGDTQYICVDCCDIIDI